MFSRERVRFLKKKAEVKVCAPVAYFPRWINSKKYSQFANISKKEDLEDTEVFHPRFIVIPVISRFLNGLSLFISVLNTIKAIRKSFDFDLIDAHFAYPDGVAAALIARAIKKPLVITVHGTDINLCLRSFFLRQQIRFALRRANKIIAVCQALKDSMVNLGIEADKIEVVPNGVDLEKFRPIDKMQARSELGFPRDKQIIISVGHLIERKGFHYLIEAMAQLKANNNFLVIVGEGEYRSLLEKKIKEFQLENRVHLVGAVAHQDIYKWQSAADLFVLASSREGWPTVLFESFACGNPVVATKVWGTPEAVCSSEYGILVEDQSPIKIAEAISQALNKTWNKNKLLEYARNNSWDSVIDKTTCVYSQALSIGVRSQQGWQKRLFGNILSRGFWQVGQPFGSNFSTKNKGILKGYYNDLSQKVNHDIYSQDGIPLVDYGAPIGKQFYPITIAQKALGHYEVFLRSKEEFHKQQFLLLANWLISNQKINNSGCGVWEVNFSLPRIYRLKTPWISAMAQGQAISVLLRAHQETKEQKYLDAAKKALRAFDCSIEEGGVKTQEEDGTIFYEEYPSKPYSHVLNGFIFALWGLYDYAKYLNDDHASLLFNQGIETLKRKLHLYDLGYWTRYDLFKSPIIPIASKFYHQLHTDQLRALYQMTNEKLFNQFALKWEKYSSNKVSQARYLLDKFVLKLYNVLILKG